MRKNRNSDNACLWRGKNSFQPQKASKRAFDKYSINAGKKQSAVLAFLQNAAKHPETAFRTEFYQNRDTLPSNWPLPPRCVIKGIGWNCAACFTRRWPWSIPPRNEISCISPSASCGYSNTILPKKLETANFSRKNKKSCQDFKTTTIL